MKIRTVEQVYRAAGKGKALWVARWRRWSPAAFLISMQCQTLMCLVNSGIYTKKEEAHADQ